MPGRWRVQRYEGTKIQLLEDGCWKERDVKSKIKVVNWGKANVVSQEGNWMPISLMGARVVAVTVTPGRVHDNLIRAGEMLRHPAF
jgi:hypothetical protein